MKVEYQCNVTHLITDESINKEYSQFSTRYDVDTKSIWCWMKPLPRPCLNEVLVDELVHLQNKLTFTYKNQNPDEVWPFRHFILASKIPYIFNLGGDLEFFKQCITSGDKQRLTNYAYKCVNLLHGNIDNLDLPITMISLVQGQALGGGFEAALSCDVIVAERGSQLGFPEILFNLFPGMGAYNLLARRIGPSLAERIILSGRTFMAEELYEMGVIDVLTDTGNGSQAILEYMNSHNQSHNTIKSFKKIRQIVHPIEKDKLFDIVDIWIDAAMSLTNKDLAKMERLLHLQKDLKDTRRIDENDSSIKPRGNDWRKIKDVDFPLTTHLGETVYKNRRKNNERRRHVEETEECCD